jgi:hypothetical protein
VNFCDFKVINERDPKHLNVLETTLTLFSLEQNVTEKQMVIDVTLDVARSIIRPMASTIRSSVTTRDTMATSKCGRLLAFQGNGTSSVTDGIHFTT